jgi:hypothetical protein
MSKKELEQLRQKLAATRIDTPEFARDFGRDFEIVLHAELPPDFHFEGDVADLTWLLEKNLAKQNRKLADCTPEEVTAEIQKLNLKR